VNDAINDKRRIPTEDQSVDVGSVCFGHGFGFGAGQQFDHFSWFKMPGGGHDRVLVYAGRNLHRLDPCCTECGESGG
jgi:hypothetical protein